MNKETQENMEIYLNSRHYIFPIEPKNDNRFDPKSDLVERLQKAILTESYKLDA